MKKLNILVVGGGMYVSGRGTKTFGTVLPALLEARRHGLVDNIGIATTNNETALNAKATFLKLSSEMGVNNQCYIFPKEGKDENAYLNAVNIFNPDAAIISVPDHLHASISIPFLSLNALIIAPSGTPLSFNVLYTFSISLSVITFPQKHHQLHHQFLFY